MEANGDGKTLVGGLIEADADGTLWKLLLGAPDKLYRIDQDVRTGPSWPNSSSKLVPLAHSRTCGRAVKRGCLFEVTSDRKCPDAQSFVPGAFLPSLASALVSQTWLS